MFLISFHCLSFFLLLQYFPVSLYFSFPLPVCHSFFFPFPVSLSFSFPFPVSILAFLYPSLFLLSLSLFLSPFFFPASRLFLPPSPHFPLQDTNQDRLERGDSDCSLSPRPSPLSSPLPLPLLVEDFNIPLAQRLKDRAYADRAVRRTLVNSLPNFTLLPLFMSANKLKEKERAYADRAVRRTLVNFLPNFTLYSSAG